MDRTSVLLPPFVSLENPSSPYRENILLLSELDESFVLLVAWEYCLELLLSCGIVDFDYCSPCCSRDFCERKG